jgi:DNA repair protein SbcC/Rad50
MRFDAIRGHAVGPFREPFELDLRAIPGTLVAITGKNGAGKSTLLEMMAGALHRECPTRGSLIHLATSRGSFVEVDAMNGVSHRIRHLLDAVSGKGESYVTDGAGESALTSTKVSEFDAWAKAHMPTEEVLYASTFAPQGSGGFLGMREGDRKALLLRVLGIERLERLAKGARARAAALDRQLVAIDARMDAERRGAQDLAVLRDAVASNAALEEESKGKLAATREALETARARLAELERQAVEHEGRCARAVELQKVIDIARAKEKDLSIRVGNNETVLARREEILSAVARVEMLTARLADIFAEQAKARDMVATARAARDELVTRRANAVRERDVAEAEAKRARDRIADRPKIEAAEASLEQLRARIAVFDAQAEAHKATLAAARRLQLSGKDDRIKGLRDAADKIFAYDLDRFQDEDKWSAAFEMWNLAGEAILADDAIVTTIMDNPATVARLEREETALAVRLRNMEDEARSLAGIAARRARLDEAVADEARWVAVRDRMAEDLAAIDGLLARPNPDAERALDDTVRLDSERSSREADLRVLTAHKDAPRLAQAQARIEELLPQLSAATEDRQRLEAELATMPFAGARAESDRIDAVLDAEKRNIAAARAIASEAEDARTASAARRARAEHDIEIETARADVLLKYATERAPLAQDFEDWTKLGQDLGRDGLQALEIDAAGPELSELTNDLLHSCFGPRWTVTVEAQSLASDGKRMLEDLAVRVLDLEHGREALAETYSGGEKVILGEAISLALAEMSCRRAGIVDPTLVRDETGAALSEENARAYIAMLRRAAEHIGASKVLFVSHSLDVQSLADAWIDIVGGKISVRTTA